MTRSSQNVRVRVKTCCKINLFLDVLGRRPDGYHDIRSVMQSLELGDDLVITSLDPASSTGRAVDLEVTGYSVPADRSNLAVRAAELVLQACGVKGALRMRLCKRIPVASGLAGGSSDAAGTIVGLNALFGLGLSQRDMEELGSRLGSDVPFCIRCGTAKVEGVGDRLTQLPSPSSLWVVLLVPQIAVPTAEVYRLFDSWNVPRCVGADIDDIEQAIKAGDIAGIAASVYNVFYPIVSSIHPVVSQAVDFLLRAGALGAMMSGSGPSVFGIVSGESEARRIAQSAAKAFGSCFVTYTKASSGMLLERECD